MIKIIDKNKFIFKNANIRVWKANTSDYKFIMHLCNRFRDHEFFYVPDNTILDEIRKGNIIAFDYNVFEAGYIWVTFNKNGKSRINQLAVDEDLWRNKVGTCVTQVYEEMAEKYSMWCVYLSCNSNTMGHTFWPRVGYEVVCKKKAGSRGGDNIIWGKLLSASDDALFKPLVTDIKSIETYVLQSSITESVKRKKDTNTNQDELF